MTITLNGTTGITTPDLTVDTDTLVVDEANNRVGIGTSSPATMLDVRGEVSVAYNATYGLRFYNQDRNNWSSIGCNIATGTPSANLVFTDSTGEVARMTSGNLLVGATSKETRGVTLYGTGNNGFYIRTTGTCGYLITQDGVGGAGTFLTLYSNNTSVGSITTNGTSTSYLTTSDYRLKEDWQPMTGASERVKALKPVNFAWKADGSRVDGFLAHEAQAVVPEAVTGEKDAVELVDIKDEQGNVTGQEERPVYQGIDQSKLVPLLTAALQEALAEIETLKARVSALEAA